MTPPWDVQFEGGDLIYLSPLAQWSGNYFLKEIIYPKS